MSLRVAVNLKRDLTPRGLLIGNIKGQDVARPRVNRKREAHDLEFREAKQQRGS